VVTCVLAVSSAGSVVVNFSRAFSVAPTVLVGPGWSLPGTTNPDEGDAPACR